jgi:hypothetical protein
MEEDMSEVIAEAQSERPLQPVTKDIIAELRSVSRYGVTSGAKFSHPYLLLLQKLTEMRAAERDDAELQLRVHRPLYENIIREMLATFRRKISGIDLCERIPRLGQKCKSERI